MNAARTRQPIPSYETLLGYRVSELKQILRTANVASDDCIEKCDLARRALSVLQTKPTPNAMPLPPRGTPAKTSNPFSGSQAADPLARLFSGRDEDLLGKLFGQTEVEPFANLFSGAGPSQAKASRTDVTDYDRLMALKPSALRKCLESHKHSSVDCIEKSDLVKKIIRLGLAQSL